MKYFIALIYFFAFLLANTAFAETSVLELASTSSEGGSCVECSSSAGSQMMSEMASARSIRNTVSSGNEPQYVSEVIQKMELSDTCKKFADGNSYGPWGLAVVKELETNKYDELIRGSQDLMEVCPGYQQMNRDGKNGLWVVIMAAMAEYESSCREKPALVQGPNGTLIGLMQLHMGHEGVYADGCKNGDGKTATGSIRCTMSIIDKQLGGGNNLFIARPHFEVLQTISPRRIYLKMRKAIHTYSLCK